MQIQTAQDWDCLVIMETVLQNKAICAGRKMLFLPGVHGIGRNEPTGQKVPAWHCPKDPEAGAAMSTDGKNRG